MEEVLDHLYALSQLLRQGSATHVPRFKVIECRNIVRLPLIPFSIICHVSFSLVEPFINKDMTGMLLSHVILAIEHPSFGRHVSTFTCLGSGPSG